MHTLSNQITYASREAHNRLNDTVTLWLKQNQPDFTCKSILLDLANDDGYMAQEKFDEMHAFVLNLLAFFCIPENTNSFNKLFGLYSEKDWPTFLVQIANALAHAQNPYPIAELIKYQTKFYCDLTAAQIDYLSTKFKVVA